MALLVTSNTLLLLTATASIVYAPKCSAYNLLHRTSPLDRIPMPESNLIFDCLGYIPNQFFSLTFRTGTYLVSKVASLAPEVLFPFGLNYSRCHDTLQKLGIYVAHTCAHARIHAQTGFRVQTDTFSLWYSNFKFEIPSYIMTQPIYVDLFLICAFLHRICSCHIAIYKHIRMYSYTCL